MRIWSRAMASTMPGVCLETDAALALISVANLLRVLGATTRRQRPHDGTAAPRLVLMSGAGNGVPETWPCEFLANASAKEAPTDAIGRALKIRWIPPPPESSDFWSPASTAAIPPRYRHDVRWYRTQFGIIGFRKGSTILSAIALVMMFA